MLDRLYTAHEPEIKENQTPARIRFMEIKRKMPGTQYGRARVKGLSPCSRNQAPGAKSVRNMPALTSLCRLGQAKQNAPSGVETEGAPGGTD